MLISLRLRQLAEGAKCVHPEEKLHLRKFRICKGLFLVCNARVPELVDALDFVEYIAATLHLELLLHYGKTPSILLLSFSA
jgi:hypothetical protein